MENSSGTSVYIAEKGAHALEQSSRLKCSGSTLGSMKLHGRWWIKCGLCILHCLPVEARQFWYDVLAYDWHMFWCNVWEYVHMYMDVNIAMSYVIKLQ